MAASLSRPDPSSPASVAEAGFSTTRRGFNQDEVRAFLTSVAAELSRVQERERQLQAQVDDLDAKVGLTPELDEEAVAAMLGEETLRVLQTARESASQIKIRAEESAAKILGDANDEANRLRQEAELEAARKRHDAASDAEAEVALAKQQGREMVNEARAYRERVLADLERRTNLARQQIEELVHGRDRLLQVFERARLVAVDVTSELQTIDGPDELVNLSPTTGPLPIMVPTTSGSPGEADGIDADQIGIGERTETDSDPSEIDVPVDAADVDADVDADASATEHELVDDLAPDGPEAADDEAADDADDDADGDDDGGDATTSLRRDANVVSLFRDRQPPTGDEAHTDDETTDDATDATDDTDDTDVETAGDDAAAPKRAVDDIFERLRGESPETAPVVGADPAVDAEPDTAPDPVAVIEPTATDDSATADLDGDDTVVDGEPVDTAFSRREEVLTPLIVAGARKLKRVLADEQNGVLDQLRGKQAVNELADVIPETDEHGATYRDALDDELLDAAVAGAAEVGKNDTKTLRTTLRKGALDAAHAVVRDDLLQPLRDRLERAITDGAGDNDDITKRVRAVYREWKTQHIDDQLDDAFRFAYGGGLAAGVKPGTDLVWTIDPAEATCPDCEDNSLSGAVPSGQPFPTGHTMAPAHAGCRCLTLPSTD